MNTLKIVLWFCVIYAALCFVSLNRHSRAEPFTYHSELWADKAGYNVYLPLLFIYPDSFPDSLATKTGDGFRVDPVSHKVVTKYPYGVALLQSPFWLAAHALSGERSGYSTAYQKSVDLAGCFYLTLGFFFLFFTLREFKPLRDSVFLILAIALSTGIFYYGIFETGMSHIYSFCCLSVIVFLCFKQTRATVFANWFWHAVAASVFVILRPVNVIFLIPALLFFLYNSKQLNFASFKTLTVLQLVMTGCAVLMIVFPQLLYYKYAFGSFFSNSYQKEPFFFPTFSRIATMLFSVDNGLFVYYPVMILVIVFSFIQRSVYTKLLLPLLIIYSLLYASWWSLDLGCGFGHRAINDIVLLFFLPFCFSAQKIPRFLWLIVLILAFVNVKFIFSYDGCLYGEDPWNYDEYRSILFGPFK